MDHAIKQKLDSFFGQFRTETYDKGEILIRAGEAPRSIFHLTQGHVRQYVITREGDEMTLNIYKPVSFFPAAWVLDVYNRVYYFEAMDTVKIVVAPKEAVLEFLQAHPEVVLDLLKRMSVGLEGILTRMEYLMTGTATERLIAVLLIAAKRFGEKTGREVHITLRLTHKELASQVGISRETVSREIHQLKERNLVTYTASEIIIPDIRKLEESLAQ